MRTIGGDDTPLLKEILDPFGRESLCIANKTTVLRPSDVGFREEVARNFVPAESRLLEQTVRLKRRLQNVTTHDFWQILMEGMTEAMGSQYAFVAKRILYDDENSAVEMPAFGEQGSCLMGLAFYFNDQKGHSGLHRDYKYQVYGCPCQWMRHDCALLIPDGLVGLTPNNPNADGFPIPAEAYLAVPLFHEGKCYAHFGAMWTADGLRERAPLSWASLEFFLHSLEDVIGDRVLEGVGLRKPVSSENRPKLIPQGVVTGSVANPIDLRPSLQPYARRLSHELRTPMQGVVGMLDVMYASVLEATEPKRWQWPDLNQLRDVIEGLRVGIEVAQDSSKRAVDAADNMVHAYDSNMELPVTPSQLKMPEIVLNPTSLEERDSYPFPQVEYPQPEHDTARRTKRRRESEGSHDGSTPSKVLHIEESGPTDPTVQSPGGQDLAHNDTSASTGSRASGIAFIEGSKEQSKHVVQAHSVASPGALGGLFDATSGLRLNFRPLHIRQLVHEAVHESLKSGGRPDVMEVVQTAYGEHLTVQMMEVASGRQAEVVDIEIFVDEAVPQTIITDSQALSKVIFAVFHNAFKFTPSGRITLSATVFDSRQILFAIVDTGQGIPADFLPNLFKPFAREDETLTRNRDGLGLGLMVAKLIARKIGGDLWCERTATDGDQRGTEFRIRTPITPPYASTSAPAALVHHFRSAPTTPALGINSGSIDNEGASGALVRSASEATVGDLHVRRAKWVGGRQYDSQLAAVLPLKILVVEDNRINRSLLCSMLRKLGYKNVSEARDGVEAVEMVTATLPTSDSVVIGGMFDLILMDLWMPRMDGYEASERIAGLYEQMTNPSNNATEKRLTILAVSADATEEARTKAANKGIHGFVGKPFGISELGRAIMHFRGVDLTEN